MRHLVQTATEKSATRPRFVFYIDEDDFGSLQTAKLMQQAGHSVTWVGEPRGTRPMSDWWNVCASAANAHGVVMFADDEAQFRTIAWDIWVLREFDRWPDKAILIQPNDTIHGDADAGYYFVHWPTWRGIFGRLTPPYFEYGYADVWPMEVARAAGRKVYLHLVVIQNLAPVLQPPDQTHQDNLERAKQQRPGDLYLSLQHERELEVSKLRAYAGLCVDCGSDQILDRGLDLTGCEVKVCAACTTRQPSKEVNR